jgi:hypothetical protein
MGAQRHQQNFSEVAVHDGAQRSCRGSLAGNRSRRGRSICSRSVRFRAQRGCAPVGLPPHADAPGVVTLPEALSVKRGAKVLMGAAFGLGAVLATGYYVQRNRPSAEEWCTSLIVDFRGSLPPPGIYRMEVSGDGFSSRCHFDSVTWDMQCTGDQIYLVARIDVTGIRLRATPRKLKVRVVRIDSGGNEVVFEDATVFPKYQRTGEDCLPYKVDLRQQ